MIELPQGMRYVHEREAGRSGYAYWVAVVAVPSTGVVRTGHGVADGCEVKAVVAKALEEQRAEFEEADSDDDVNRPSLVGWTGFSGSAVRVPVESCGGVGAGRVGRPR